MIITQIFKKLLSAKISCIDESTDQNILLCGKSKRTMLVLHELRSNREKYVDALKKRGKTDFEAAINEVLKLDEQRKSIQQELDGLLAQSNQLSRQIGQLMKEGKKEEANSVKSETAELKEKSKRLSSSLTSVETSIQQTLYNIPNVPNDLVPEGSSEEDNQTIKQMGDLPQLMDSAKPHWDLIEEYDIIDFELGNKVTGAGFPFYKGQGARLMRAMVNFFLDEAAAAGYEEVQPPVLINEDSGYGTGQLPDKEGQMYHIEDTNLYLIPTAEVPITNIYRNVILNTDQLPVKKVGFTPCFRREAGSWGSHVRGLNRLHQFDKVEIVQIAKPDQSYQILEEMVAHVESVVAKLGLPYRILRLCGGDLGFTSAITYDFEVFSAAQKKWLEVSSVSNFENYQANRLKLRFKDDKGKKVLAHTLNGSALALPRIVAAVLENNQTAEGIVIPEVLRPYTGFDIITKG